MDEQAQWEYRVSVIDDKPETVDANMQKWADAGWELISATSAPIRSVRANAFVWGIRYAMFWRRPRP